MHEFCSFCRQSGFLSNVVSLEGLEFEDRNGWSTSVTKILEEILPEVTDATAICKECLQTINNFYQLKRDLNLGFYKYGYAVEQKFIKDEFGEFSLVSDSNCESIESSSLVRRTRRNTKEPEVKSSSKKSSRNKTANARLVSLEEEKDDQLIETEELVETEGADVFLKPEKSRKDPLPLPSSELEEFKALAEKSNGDGFRCPICSEQQLSSTKCYRHMVYEHSRNKKLMQKWIEHQVRKNSEFSDCSRCPRSFNSQHALRYHLFSHIINGEIGDAEFLSSRCDNKSSKYYRPKTSSERRNEWRMRHPELAKAVQQEYSKKYRDKLKSTASQERLLELRRKSTERKRKSRARKKEQKIKQELYT